MDDIRLFVSFVNWHLWFLLEHSEHAEVSVASHCREVSTKTTYAIEGFNDRVECIGTKSCASIGTLNVLELRQ